MRWLITTIWMLPRSLRLAGPSKPSVKTFLEDGGFRNLGHAMQELGMEPQELWSMIMREADLPDCMMPEMIQIGHAN